MEQKSFWGYFQQLLINEDIVKIKEQLFEEVPNIENIEILPRAQGRVYKVFRF